MQISIIIPVYNAELYLEDCIQSLLNQTMTDIQFVFVNDGSTDRSLEILKKHAAVDVRITIISQRNEGVSSARNAGLDFAEGDYIGWVDADDFVELDMFEVLYENLIKFNADISECNFASYKNSIKYPSGFGKKIEYGSGDFLRDKYLSADIFYGLYTKLFKREIFDDFRFLNGRIWEDIYLVTILCTKQYRYVRIPDVKYYYRYTSNGIVGTKFSYKKAREALYSLENSLDTISCFQENKNLYVKLYLRNMEKAVMTYLQLKFSKDKKMRYVYAVVYAKRMQYNILDCFRSKELTKKDQFRFLISKIGLSNLVRFLIRK